MWCYLCLVLPVVHTWPKWHCVANTRGQGCTEVLLALVALWVVGIKQQVLGSLNGTEVLLSCGATSARCHWWCALGPSGSVRPPGGRGGQQHCWLLWAP